MAEYRKLVEENNTILIAFGTSVGVLIMLLLIPVIVIFFIKWQQQPHAQFQQGPNQSWTLIQNNMADVHKKNKSLVRSASCPG